MPAKKKTRLILLIGFLVLLLGGGGGFGALYYNAVSQIDVDIETIYITRYDLGGTLLNPTMDVDLEINAKISNPTTISVDITYATFEIYFEGDFCGTGQTDPFKASQVPSDLRIESYLEDIAGSMYVELFDLVVLGNSKTVTIQILVVKTMGISFELNQNISVVVTQDDIL